MNLERILQIQMKLQGPICRALVPLLRYRQLARRKTYYRSYGPCLQASQLMHKDLIYPGSSFKINYLIEKRPHCRFEPDDEEPIIPSIESISKQHVKVEAHHILGITDDITEARER